jgi:flagellar hook assembly protein FlgD
MARSPCGSSTVTAGRTTLVNEPMSRGTFRTKWDGKDRSGVDVASGLYFAEIKGKLGRDTKRLTLLK